MRSLHKRVRAADSSSTEQLPLPFFSVQHFAVPARLRPWVECIFVNGETSRSSDYSFFRVPELSTQLGLVIRAFDVRPSGVFPSSAKILLGGAQQKLYSVPFPAPEVLVFQLRPGTLKALQIPREPLRDAVVDVQEVAPAFGNEALGRISEEADVCLRVRALCDLLEHYLHSESEIQRANALVRVCTNDRSTRDWANVAGYSERQLRRIFLDVFGLAPKEFAKVQRIRAVFRDVACAQSWADTALQCGYHDQSHLIHEFRAAVGDTPESFAQKLAEPRLLGGTTAIIPRVDALLGSVLGHPLPR